MITFDLQVNPGNAPWPLIADAARAAEAAGFDTFWTADHLAGQVMSAPNMPECFTTLGALAAEGHAFQALWADDACLDERRAEQPDAGAIAAARAAPAPCCSTRESRRPCLKRAAAEYCAKGRVEGRFTILALGNFFCMRTRAVSMLSTFMPK